MKTMVIIQLIRPISDGSPAIVRKPYLSIIVEFIDYLQGSFRVLKAIIGFLDREDQHLYKVK